MKENAKRFTDDQARAILARAIELDSRDPMTTTDDLRVIAADVGISPASLEAALRESEKAVDTHRSIVSRRTANAVAAVGVPLGVAAGLVVGSSAGHLPGSLLAAVGLTSVGLVASGALVVLQGTAGTLRSFHLRNLALWAGVAAGSLMAVTFQGYGGVPVIMALGWCLASSILGSAAAVAVQRARRADRADVDPDVTRAALPAGGGRWARIAGRIREWITQPLRRENTTRPWVFAFRDSTLS